MSCPIYVSLILRETNSTSFIWQQWSNSTQNSNISFHFLQHKSLRNKIGKESLKRVKWLLLLYYRVFFAITRQRPFLTACSAATAFASHTPFSPARTSTQIKK